MLLTTNTPPRHVRRRVTRFAAAAALAFAAGLLLHGPAACAQTPDPLGLTAAQKAKMQAIKTKYQPQADKLRAQMKPIVEQMRLLQVKADKEMVALLTPAQQAKLKQIQTARLQQLRQMQQQQMQAAGVGGNATTRKP